MDEETDKLINAVHSYSPLWDMKDKRYHSRGIQRKLWAKVAAEMESDVATVKKKWKGLRDSFRREHKKFLKSGQEAPDQFVSLWPFFEQMFFLSCIMHPRELKGNVSPHTNDPTETDDSQDTQSQEKHHEYSETDQGNSSETEETDLSNLSVAAWKMRPPPPSEQEIATKGVQTKKDSNTKTNDDTDAVPSLEMGPLPFTPPSVKRKKVEIKKTYNTKASTKAACDAEFLKIEREKLQLFSENMGIKTDSEYQFLISLLPHLKKIPENRQLSVRNKIQQVLIDEQERHTSFQLQSPVPYASPSNVGYPPSHSSWISDQRTSDVASQSSWTSEDQPAAPLLPSCWNSQPRQPQSLLCLSNPGQIQPNTSPQAGLTEINNENTFLTL